MKKYTPSDLRRLSWKEYGRLIDTLVASVLSYSKKHNINFHIIAPILRGGAIPAVVLANKLGIIPFLPIQVKYSKDWKINALSTVKLLSNTHIPEVPNIILVDNLTYSGGSAQKARGVLQAIYPKSKIYFATVENVAVHETKKRSGFKKFFYGINTPKKRKINIYPFQDLTRELKSLNNE